MIFFKIACLKIKIEFIISNDRIRNKKSHIHSKHVNSEFGFPNNVGGVASVPVLRIHDHFLSDKLARPTLQNLPLATF
jgi:hypothetical protein